MFKKEDELSKENYRPGSVLSRISKIFERIAFNQMNLLFEATLTPLLTRFRENHNTKNALLNVIGKWKHALDKEKKADTIFMNLSKAFDVFNRNLLLAKPNVCGFSYAIKFVQSH